MTIETMADGQYGFCTAWTMWRDEDGLFWLIGTTPLDSNETRTANMQVFKYNGKHYVDTSMCHYIWNNQEGGAGVPVHQITHGGLSQKFTP